ncbi:MAG: hypothetical protein OEY38_21970 [Gammaproteobacteria bacterium]|nr:hypothetical protein [Gammaproteobacteria bacterium]
MMRYMQVFLFVSLSLMLGSTLALKLDASICDSKYCDRTADRADWGDVPALKGLFNKREHFSIHLPLSPTHLVTTDSLFAAKYSNGQLIAISELNRADYTYLNASSYSLIDWANIVFHKHRKSTKPKNIEDLRAWNETLFIKKMILNAEKISFVEKKNYKIYLMEGKKNGPYQNVAYLVNENVPNSIFQIEFDRFPTRDIYQILNSIP